MDATAVLIEHNLQVGLVTEATDANADLVAEALKQNLQNLLDMAKAGVVNEKEATELLKAVEVKSTADSASMVLSVPAETMKAFLVRLATPANK